MPELMPETLTTAVDSRTTWRAALEACFYGTTARDAAASTRSATVFASASKSMMSSFERCAARVSGRGGPDKLRGDLRPLPACESPARKRP